MRLELRTHAATPVVFGLLALGSLALAILAPSHTLFFGIVFVLLGLATYAIGRQRIIVDDAGVSVRGMIRRRNVPWSDIVQYRFWSQDNVMPNKRSFAYLLLMLRRPHRGVWQISLALVTRSNSRIMIDARYAKLAQALDSLFAELHRRLPPTFAPFTLTDTHLTHAKKGSLALADIERIDVIGLTLAIYKRGKRFVWVREHMSQIENVMMLVEQLAERGLVIATNPFLFVPPSALDKLRAAAARQAGMPQARVVVRH